MPEEIVTMQDGRKIIATVSRLPADSHCTVGDCRNPTSNILRDLPVCRACFDTLQAERNSLEAVVVVRTAERDEARAQAHNDRCELLDDIDQLRALLRKVREEIAALADYRDSTLTLTELVARIDAIVAPEGRDG